MLSILLSILGVIVTILLVVGVHEFGHFIVARMCGIKVLRFSIGFGKTLKSWHDKSGTEYVLAAIPLGGYIKMLDENESDVPEEDLAKAYNRQPLYKRIPVIIAGPLANLIFATLIYWFLFIVGFNTYRPIIGEITPNSIAAQAGLQSQTEIVQIDHEITPSWYTAVLKLLMRTGDKNQLVLETQPLKSEKTTTHSLNLASWEMDKLKPDPLVSLGIKPYEPNVLPIITEIKPDSPAALAGLKPGDRVTNMDNKLINDWIDLATLISQSPGKTLQITVLRDKKSITLPITIGTKYTLFRKAYGFIGVIPHIEARPDLIRHNQFGPIAAIPHALDETWNFIYLNFIVIGKMLTGKISVQSLGGPITIFESAGNALNQGMTPFCGFLAFLSISIGIINILPIPGLDGGHLLFQLIEFIRRKPVSERVQGLFFRLGFIALMVLMVQALVNDIMRM